MAVARPGRSVRVGIFAGVVAWHALVVVLLLQQRVVLTHAPELVMTWLQLEPEPRPRLPDPTPLTARLVTPSAALPPPPDLAPPAESPPNAPSTAITQPSSVDWYREASRAARDQFADRLATPRSLESQPKAMDLPPPKAAEHKLGDLEPNGHGFRLWVSKRCWTDIQHEAPLPPASSSRCPSPASKRRRRWTRTRWNAASRTT